MNSGAQIHFYQVIKINLSLFRLCLLMNHSLICVSDMQESSPECIPQVQENEDPTLAVKKETTEPLDTNLDIGSNFLQTSDCYEEVSSEILLEDIKPTVVEGLVLGSDSGTGDISFSEDSSEVSLR